MKTFKPPTLDDVMTVFDKWNFYKGQGNWKSHRELTYETKIAIVETLKHYTLIQICEAIENYATILLGREYKWSYAWTLYQFLMRNRPDNRQEKQFWRFLGSNFRADDYLTETAKKEGISRQQSLRAYQRHLEELQERLAFYEKQDNTKNAEKIREIIKELTTPKGQRNFVPKNDEMVTADKVREQRDKLINNFGKI